jgi:hypothetical protein
VTDPTSNGLPFPLLNDDYVVEDGDGGAYEYTDLVYEMLLDRRSRKA